MPFDGATYDSKIDGMRLGQQLGTVLHLMRDGTWRTLREIADRTGYPEASVSARLRDIRKPKFAGHFTMESRRRALVYDWKLRRRRGTWEYRVVRVRKQPTLPELELVEDAYRGAWGIRRR